MITTKRISMLAVLAASILGSTQAFAAGGTMPSLVHDIGISLLTAGLLALIFHRFKIKNHPT